jgi:hypothetical protein
MPTSSGTLDRGGLRQAAEQGSFGDSTGCDSKSIKLSGRKVVSGGMTTGSLEDPA